MYILVKHHLASLFSPLMPELTSKSVGMPRFTGLRTPVSVAENTPIIRTEAGKGPVPGYKIGKYFLTGCMCLLFAFSSLAADRPVSHHNPRKRFKVFIRTLNLTPDQQKRVRAIFRDIHKNRPRHKRKRMRAPDNLYTADPLNGERILQFEMGRIQRLAERMQARMRVNFRIHKILNQEQRDLHIEFLQITSRRKERYIRMRILKFEDWFDSRYSLFDFDQNQKQRLIKARRDFLDSRRDGQKKMRNILDLSLKKMRAGADADSVAPELRRVILEQGARSVKAKIEIFRIMTPAQRRKFMEEFRLGH